MAAGGRTVSLVEVLEDAGLRLGGEADAGVPDRDADPGIGRVGPFDADAHFSAVGELHGVGDQVRQDLPHPPGVAGHLAVDAGAQVDDEAQPLAAGLQLIGGGDLAHCVGEVERLGRHLDVAAFEPRQVDDVGQQGLQRHGRGADGLHHLALVLVERGLGEHLGDAEHAVQRRVQLVADVGQELALGAVGRLCGVAGVGQDLVGPAELGDVHHHGDQAAIACPPTLGADPALAVLVLFSPELAADGHARLEPFGLVAGRLGVSPGGEVLLQEAAVRHPFRESAGRIDQLGVPAVPDDDLIVGVEEGDPLGHGLDGLLQVGDGASAAPALQGDQVGDRQQSQGRAGDADGQHRIGEASCGKSPGGGGG